MGEPARRKATYEDLLALPPQVVGEILDGELYTSPRPSPRHSRAAGITHEELSRPYDRPPGGPHGPGGWWILFEPEVHLEDHIVVPDLAGWRRERLVALPREAHIALAPDWVCEVLSPSTERMDRIIKQRIYAREGVSHLWLVNPLLETVEVYRLRDGLWAMVAAEGGDGMARLEPFEAVELNLARWWGRE